MKQTSATTEALAGRPSSVFSTLFGRAALWGAALGLVALAPPEALSAEAPPEPAYTVAERGEDFAVYQRVTALTNVAGQVSYRTNQFTLLENCLHYFEDGQWKPSEEVIESFPDGAIARRGPHKAIFA